MCRDYFICVETMHWNILLFLSVGYLHHIRGKIISTIKEKCFIAFAFILHLKFSCRKQTEIEESGISARMSCFFHSLKKSILQIEIGNVICVCVKSESMEGNWQ